MSVLNNDKKYTMEEMPIGKGATSQLFIGVNQYNQKVAIKKVKNQAEANHEAGILRSLPVHKHLISILDFFEEDSYGNIVLEFHPGARLGHFKKGEIRERKLAIQITLNILEGLRVIHENGILHCDLTPHNVLIYDDDPRTVKIIDFGSSVRKNRFGKFSGNHKGATKWYRPPELKKTDNGFIGHLNNSSDLYSAASVCLYLLNGKAPFRKKAACKLVENKDLQKVLKKATRANMLMRYQTAQELINALQPFLL